MGGTKNIACCLPPAAIRQIFLLTREKIAEFADSIDFIETATSPLSEPDKQTLFRLLPNTRLYNNYGSSESASVCMFNYNAYRNKERCIGKPAVNAKIITLDESHRPVNASKDNPGLIACIGDMNMKGYVNDPDLTSKVMENGAVITSDLGYIDSDGFVYITGRQSDIINVGGLKVAPDEVESAALGYEGIDDCICIAEKNTLTENSLKLLVVSSEKEGKGIDLISFRKYMAEKLETYKIPQKIEYVDKIEKTYNGKINRKFYKNK